MKLLSATFLIATGMILSPFATPCQASSDIPMERLAKKVRCSCGEEFDIRFCPNCGTSYVSCLEAERKGLIQPSMAWWMEKHLVGEYENIVDKTQPLRMGAMNVPARLSILENGEVVLTVVYPTGSVEYAGTLKENIPDKISMRRKDGKPVGSGSACQPGFSADIRKPSKDLLVFHALPMPHPVSFPGFMLEMISRPHAATTLPAPKSCASNLTDLKCPACGAASKQRTKFCTECGARLPIAETD